MVKTAFAIAAALALAAPAGPSGPGELQCLSCPALKRR